MLPGIFIVLFFFALGELVGWLVNGFIPGSVIGMMLLFTALCLKWVKPERIKPVARFLCDNMALFFVPAGVGIVNALDILSQYWQAVLVACAVSTVMVIVVSLPASRTGAVVMAAVSSVPLIVSLMSEIWAEGSSSGVHPSTV